MQKNLEFVLTVVDAGNNVLVAEKIKEQFAAVSVKLEIKTVSGEQIEVIDGELLSSYSLNITNTDYLGNYADKNLPNQQVVSQTLDFIYQTFSNFLDTVLS